MCWYGSLWASNERVRIEDEDDEEDDMMLSP
jgi:hypothetical protein